MVINKRVVWIGCYWSFVSFPVTVGQNNLNGNMTRMITFLNGQDCAWIDYIVFPPIDLGQLVKYHEIILNFQLFPNPTIGKFLFNINDNKIHSINIL